MCTVRQLNYLYNAQQNLAAEHKVIGQIQTFGAAGSHTFTPDRRQPTQVSVNVLIKDVGTAKLTDDKFVCLRVSRKQGLTSERTDGKHLELPCGLIATINRPNNVHLVTNADVNL